VEAGGIYALKTRSCVTEIRKETFGIRKTARRFSACLAVCMAAAYFEKMKKFIFSKQNCRTPYQRRLAAS
jgi:hypothetical protein